jgi:beta-glucosidase
MNLPAKGSLDRLIKAVCAVNQSVIIVNSTGVAISMPWLSQVSAVLQAWFGGQEAGNSIVDVLFGAVNPSGKLPVSFPRSIEDTPAFENFPGDLGTLQVHYKEGLNIGYRYYDQYPEKTLFPFGFGLSYTEFDIITSMSADQQLIRGGSIKVSATVKNIGTVVGSEVVQVYITSPVKSVDMPPKQLAGFAKVSLEPGKSKSVSISVDYQSAAYWSVETDRWIVEKGQYEILVGNSSQKTTLAGTFAVAENFGFSA